MKIIEKVLAVAITLVLAWAPLGAQSGDSAYSVPPTTNVATAGNDGFVRYHFALNGTLSGEEVGNTHVTIYFDGNKKVTVVNDPTANGGNGSTQVSVVDMNSGQTIGTMTYNGNDNADMDHELASGDAVTIAGTTISQCTVTRTVIENGVAWTFSQNLAADGSNSSMSYADCEQLADRIYAHAQSGGPGGTTAAQAALGNDVDFMSVHGIKLTMVQTPGAATNPDWKNNGGADTTGATPSVNLNLVEWLSTALMGATHSGRWDGRQDGGGYQEENKLALNASFNAGGDVTKETTVVMDFSATGGKHNDGGGISGITVTWTDNAGGYNIVF